MGGMEGVLEGDKEMGRQKRRDGGRMWRMDGDGRTMRPRDGDVGRQDPNVDMEES